MGYRSAFGDHHILHRPSQTNAGSQSEAVKGGSATHSTTIGHYKEKIKIGLKMAMSDHGLAHDCLGTCDVGRGQGLTGSLGPCITLTQGPHES
ncbi:hypothetical protein E2C01_083692 [Portunus trituberculatus]|uniref:Uncharacterized protein n=1 Tax=Portunus trituberculatus TaxID=210409 RepID=A0A5B7IT44_PORTR|nr:hypothetical protein [Portunus trituberculatus]